METETNKYTLIDTSKILSNTVFLKHNDINQPILELRYNGDILVKGKLITNDMEVVDALREFLGGQGYKFNPPKEK